MLNIFNNCINFTIIYQFLQKEGKFKSEKCGCSLYDKKKYVVHIRTLKQALNYGLVLQKVHRVITFNQKTWLQPRRFYLTGDMMSLYPFSQG